MNSESKGKVILKAIGYLLAFLAINFLIDILSGAIYGAFLQPNFDFLKQTEGSVAYVLIFTQVIKLIFVMVYIGFRKNSYMSKHNESYIMKDKTNDSHFRSVVIGLGLAGFGNILLGSIMNIFKDAELIKNNIDMINNAVSYNNLSEQIVITIAVVIMAPIMEELLFRGILFREEELIASPKAAIILSALGFSIYHANLLQSINTLFLGLALAFVYHYRRNIIDCILVHMANNAVATFSGIHPYVAIASTIICLVSLFVGIKFLRDYKKEYDREISQEEILENQ